MSREEIEALTAAWADPSRLKRPSECIFCRTSRIWWNGYRMRTASVLMGQDSVLVEAVCRRAKCAGCRKSWTVRPAGLVAHKHYQLCLVAHVLQAYLFAAKATQAEVTRSVDASERSLRRWTEWTAQLAKPQTCQRQLLAAADAVVLPELREVPEVERKARKDRRGLLVVAAQVLCLLEALGCAWGLEPPGLRGVLEQVTMGRAGWCTYARPIIPEDAWRQAAPAKSQFGG